MGTISQSPQVDYATCLIYKIKIVRHFLCRNLRAHINMYPREPLGGYRHIMTWEKHANMPDRTSNIPQPCHNLHGLHNDVHCTSPCKPWHVLHVTRCVVNFLLISCTILQFLLNIWHTTSSCSSLFCFVLFRFDLYLIPYLLQIYKYEPYITRNTKEPKKSHYTLLTKTRIMVWNVEKLVWLG